MKGAEELVDADILAGVQVNATGKGSAWRLGYLVVTRDDLILLKAKPGMLTPAAVSELDRAPRETLVNAEVGSAMLAPPLTLTFKTGDPWELEIPRLHVGRAHEVLKALRTPVG